MALDGCWRRRECPVAVDGPVWPTLVLLVPHLQACHSQASMLIVVVPVLFLFDRLPKLHYLIIFIAAIVMLFCIVRVSSEVQAIIAQIFCYDYFMILL
jgi:hypothetical protein